LEDKAFTSIIPGLSLRLPFSRPSPRIATINSEIKLIVTGDQCPKNPMKTVDLSFSLSLPLFKTDKGSDMAKKQGDASGVAIPVEKNKCDR
jgi:hypothetical protein